MAGRTLAVVPAVFAAALALRPQPEPEPRCGVEMRNVGLHVRGSLHKGVTVPFSMVAEASAAPGGAVRLHATKLKAVGVPVKGLLDLFGVDIADLMKAPAGSGIRADGDDLLLDTTAMLPPPRTEGRVQQVAIAGRAPAITCISSAGASASAS
jgi:hypothetical protein